MNAPLTAKPVEHGIYRGNRAIIILRNVLWLLPAIILPVAILFAGWLGDFWFLSGILMFVAFAAIGYFDMLLIHQQNRSLATVKRKKLFRWAITFAVIQLIIAPSVLFLLVVFITAMRDLIKPGFSIFP